MKMIQCENQSAKYSHRLRGGCVHLLKKIISGLQGHFTVIKLFALLAIIFTLLTVLLSLLYNSCFQQTYHPVLQTRSTEKYVYIERYKHEEIIPRDTHRHVLSTREVENTRRELLARKEKLEDYCRLLNNTSNSNLEKTLANMIIDTKHGVSWCPIYKAASSTWMKHFAMLGGTLTEMAMELIRENVLQINKIVRMAFPHDPDLNNTYQRLNKTKKFLIVRHPFERLVSAYRDKLEHMSGREYYYKRFGRYITHKYRGFHRANETKLEPTFTEFLRFIVDERYFDEHWAPFFDTCKPCSIRYDYILKLDTFERDQCFLIQDLGLQRYLYYRHDDLKNVNPRGITSKAVVKRYLRKVPKEILDQVYKVYEKDFKMFSYSPV